MKLFAVSLYVTRAQLVSRHTFSSVLLDLNCKYLVAFLGRSLGAYIASGYTRLSKYTNTHTRPHAFIHVSCTSSIQISK